VHTASVLVEAYLRVAPGQSNAVIAAKRDRAAGYCLALGDGGAPIWTLTAAGTVATLGCTNGIADGRWHHVLAEADRRTRRMALYCDGVRVATGPLTLPPGASLASRADFVACQGLACTIEFLRVAQGSLADAQTTIEELYAWQFDGPQFRDFCGMPPAGPRRAAGALECRP
jgi:hypothetical protein